MADSRFFPWFKLELVPVTDNPAERAALTAALKTLMPIDRNFYEADVKVIMRYGLFGNMFEVTIAGLSGLLYDAIKPQKTGIKIHLGYYGGDDAQVLEGIINEKSAAAGDCFYETKLKGVETAFYRLQQACVTRNFEANTDLRQILEHIGEVADVNLDAVGIIPDSNTTIPRQWSFDQKTGLDALRRVETRLRRIEDYGLSLRDSQIRYAHKVGRLNNMGQVIADAYSYDNFLVKTNPVHRRRSGQRRRCGENEHEDNEVLIGYDFEMLGDPRLKPGDTVTFIINENNTPQTKVLTIESITHESSRENGYRSKGRVLHADRFLQRVFEAMAPGAEQVGDEVNNLLARNQERFPAVNVGDITDYTPQEHLVNATLGLEFEPTMTSPSIQVRHEAEGFALQRRPLASPFAWNLCGLVVPVYVGMRAVAVHNRYLREDALLNGFIWTEEMAPPPNEAGDYWLCLPLDVPEDRPPNDSDKAANDLTTGDGKRVIQLKGLRITIGDGLLENLGDRPGNVGTDNELQIEHSSGAKITMKDSEIKLEASGRTLTIASGKVSVT
jgi:hypothetical protein